MNENGYSYGNSGGMDDDSFNVFNQNAEAYQQQQEALRQQAAQAQEAAVQQQQALAQAHEAKENAMVIEDEPKKKTIFDKLKKKKEPQEERKFDLNDPSTFTKVEKEKKEISDDEKKKYEVILLLVLVVVLGAVGFWAFTVFKDSMGLKNIDNSGSLIHEIENVGNYSCEKSIDYLYFAVPASDKINKQLSNFVTTYYSEENKVAIKEERILIHYNNLDNDTYNTVLNYCNAYNNINDSYQVTCSLSYNVMIITNRFDLKKIEGTISNGNIIYDIGINKETLTKDIVNEESQSGSKCTIKIEEEK